jgi:hypothetical protein
MRADDKQRATEFVKELYAAGGIDEVRFEVGIARALAATTDAELADAVQSLPPPACKSPGTARQAPHAVAALGESV